jgi:hypothetical protein
MQSTRSANSRRSRRSVLLASMALAVVAGGLTACGQSVSAVPNKPAWVYSLPGNGTAAVRWGAPTKAKGITAYVAVANPGGRGCSTKGAITCLITGLANGTTYRVGVHSVGPGGSSGITTTVVIPGIAWPPRTVTVAAGDTSVALAWQVPWASPGGPVTSYTATSIPDGFQCTSSITTCTVSGLTNGQTYTFVVYATNAIGRGLLSTASPQVSPSNTAGGSTGIAYLGPVNTNQESATGVLRQRDSGISVALPNGRDLWIFGDTSSFTASTTKSSKGIAASAAAGSYGPDRTSSALRDIKPAGAPQASSTPSQLIPAPTNTVMPDGSGRACTPANGGLYAARWPTGAAMLTDGKAVFISYTDVCVTSPTSFTIEGWGFMTYAWRLGKIKLGPHDVFPPSPKGTALAAARTYRSPVVADGKVTLFTSGCTSPPIACNSGTLAATTVADNPLALGSPASYVGSPAVTDGASQWMPVDASVSAFPSDLRLIEQTSTGGTFAVFSSTSPVGPWHALSTGTLPGCSTTPKGFCSAFVGHPELATDSSLVVSYFKPDSPNNADVGHVVVALVPLPTP